MQYMLHQDDCRQFIHTIMVKFNLHEDREDWILMKQKEVPMDHYVNVRLSNILDIWSFKRKIFPDERLLNHKARLYAHVVMHKLGINYWETYSQAVNWISVRTLLVITNIHKLRSWSIVFVVAFT